MSVREADSAGAEVDPSDAELVTAVLGGEQHAFTLLYRRHAPKVSRRLRAILGQPADVEDVLQMTFLELHRSLPRYDGSRPFTGWLHGIAVNVTGRFLRSRRRRWWLWPAPPREIYLARDGRESVEEEAACGELERHLYRAMEDLSEKMRFAFVLHEIEGLALREVAELLGSSPQSVWAHVQRARARIQKRFKRENIAIDVDPKR